VPTYEFPRPAFAADVVVFAGTRADRRILLVRRGGEPFCGTWSLPGGFVEENEPPARAAARELAEETGVAVRPDCLRQLAAYAEPGRDPRGWTVSVVFILDLGGEDSETSAGDDAGEARWWTLSALPALAFDHAQVVADALRVHEGSP